MSACSARRHILLQGPGVQLLPLGHLMISPQKEAVLKPFYCSIRVVQTSSRSLISPAACVLQSVQTDRLRCGSYVCEAGYGKHCAQCEEVRSSHATALTCSEASVRALESLRLQALC